jgi:hypothetical protein
MAYLICWLFLLFCSVAIIYQDLQTREISLWLILTFTALNIWQYLLKHPIYQIIENVIFCFFYFSLIFLVLHFYYYVKTKKFQKIMDDKIGWGDLLVFFAIGFCIEPIYVVYFFTISFILSLASYLLLSSSNKSIALGACVVICYLAFSIFLLFG